MELRCYLYIYDMEDMYLKEPAPYINDNGSGVALILEIARRMADAAAHAFLTFAMTASAVNGTDKGRGLGKRKDAITHWLNRHWANN